MIVRKYNNYFYIRKIFTDIKIIARIIPLEHIPKPKFTYSKKYNKLNKIPQNKPSNFMYNFTMYLYYICLTN